MLLVYQPMVSKPSLSFVGHEPVTPSTLHERAMLSHVKISIMLIAASIKVYTVTNSDRPKQIL